MEAADTTPSPQVTVAWAVQRMAASGVRRAILPLGGLIAVGAVQIVRSGLEGPGGILLLGGLSSGLVMLAYGVQSVRRVLGRPAGAWGPLFWVASWIPYMYGLYALFLVGLRPFAVSGLAHPPLVIILALLNMLFGALLIRAQWKLSEIHLLAKEMTELVPEVSEDPGEVDVSDAGGDRKDTGE